MRATPARTPPTHAHATPPICFIRLLARRYAVERERYNAVLTGAAFLDADTALPAYWAPAVAPARATGVLVTA